jgi:hypothetical protein
MDEGRQQTLFSQNTINCINIYNQAAQDESKCGGDINVKFSPTQKVAIEALAREHGYKVSQLVREMVDGAIELFPVREKIKRHKDLLMRILSELP